MRRRQFLGLVGGAAAIGPHAAWAQQRAMPVIGFLSTVSPVGFEPRLQAFRQGLKDFGYVEGENVAIEYRWAENKLDQLAALGADLVRRQVSVIVASGGTAGAIAAKALDTKIPIVFGIPEDPVKFGLVANLGRPGGNMTGVNFFVGEILAKRLELLSELVPKAERVAVFINPSNSERATTQAKELEDAARAMRLQTRIFNTGSGRDIEAAFTDDRTRSSRRVVRQRRSDIRDSPRAARQPSVAPCNSIVVLGARDCRGRRTDELRAEHFRCLSAAWNLYRPRPQGCEAGGLAGPAVGQVRTGH